MVHGREPARITLAQLPTPLVEWPRMAAALDIPRLLCKRDDLTGLETSGNKIRKLEYVIADALAQGADTLVTNGGFQSNHCRATAAAGARLGLRVRLLLRCPDTSPAIDGNLFLDLLFGAQVTLHPAAEYSRRKDELVRLALEAERAAGRKPYFFPVGASIPLGCWGYVRCVAELIEQIGRETPADIFCAVGSGGTYAGLVLGRALLGCRKWRIIGVPICDDLAFWQQDLRRLLAETVSVYQLGLQDDELPIELLDGFIGDGYAIPYPLELDTIAQLARTEGVLLDPTYTGKAMTGMLAAIMGGQVREGALPVFIHTGGAFGLMARRELFPASGQKVRSDK